MALHYHEASSVLTQLEARRGGIKSLVFQSNFANKKLVYALVAETMKYSPALQILMNRLYQKVGYIDSGEDGSADLFAPENKWLVRVMVYDLLFGGRESIQGGSSMKKAVLQQHQHLKAALAAHMLEVGVDKHVELLPERLRGKGGAKLPRYARVNTLKTTLQEVVDAFDPIKRAQAKAERTRLWHAANGGSGSGGSSSGSGGSGGSGGSSGSSGTSAAATSKMKKNKNKKGGAGKQQTNSKNSKKKGTKSTTTTTTTTVNVATVPPTVDPHIRNLLRFPPGRDLHDHPLVVSGALILQDKSSCFSAQVLADSFPSDLQNIDMIDACAAPGNKTSHAAALLALRQLSSSTSSSSSSTSSSVYAFDKSAPRLAVLERRMKEAEADHIVHATLVSFLEVDPHDPRYANVRGVLLDPSCSGSGMASRLDHFMDGKSFTTTTTTTTMHI